MKIICIVGQCYCGKSHFIEHYLKRIFPCSVIHLGEYFRQQKFDGIRVSSEIFDSTVKLLLTSEEFEGTVIFDNAFKDVEQAEIVLSELGTQNISVIWMLDKRSNVDFKKRGREDDIYIEQKRKLWQDNADSLYQYLIDRKVDIIKVYNTDDGFLLE